MKVISKLICAAFLLSACATTSPNQGALSDDLYFLGFTPQIEGGFVHGGTGLVCPETLLGLAELDQREYGNDHKDASCSYRQDEKVATIYLSELDYDFDEVFGSAVASIYQAGLVKNIEHDDDARRSCTLGGLLISAVKADSGAANTDAYVFDAAVFHNSSLVSILQLTELDGKFLKLRYTIKNADNEERLNYCLEGAKALRGVYDLTQKKINS